MIYIKGEDPKTIEELIQRLFFKIGGADYYLGTYTYTDKECTNIQCIERKFTI